MNVLNIFIHFMLLCSLSFCLQAQSTNVCYERFLKEGMAAQEQLDFDMAINKLEAAQICPDKPLQNALDSLLTAVNKAKIQAITEARDRARLSEEKAVQQLAISESNRLAFLANQEREKGHTKAALKLAFRAMQVAGEQASEATQRAFGDAVYRSTFQKLEGHQGGIQSVEFSNDGQRLLTVGRDSSIIVWKKDGGKICHLPKFDQAIQAAHFSPDGNHFLSVSGQQLSLWDLQGQRIQKLEGHQGLIYDAVFSNQGQLLASCSRDNSLRIWDRLSGALIATCQNYKAPVTQLQFSKDDDQVLGLSADKSIKIWSTDGKTLQTLTHKNLYFGGAIFGPKAGQLLSFTVDNSIQLWEIDSGRLIQEIKGHQALIRQITLAPSQPHFISFGTDRLAILWDALGHEQVRLDDHLAAITQINFSKDGRFLLSCSQDGTAKLYKRNGQMLMDLPSFSGPVNDIAISPDNRQIALVGEWPHLFLCQHPDTYYSFLKKQPPEAFTEDEKIKYAISDIVE